MKSPMKNFFFDPAPDRRCLPRIAGLSTAIVLSVLLPALPSAAQNVAPKQTLNITAYNINL